MPDSLALMIGYLVLGAGGLYLVARLFSNSAAMLRYLGVWGSIMLGVHFVGWGATLYALADSERYSSLEVILPGIVSTAVYAAWLTCRKVAGAKLKNIKKYQGVDDPHQTSSPPSYSRVLRWATATSDSLAVSA